MVARPQQLTGSGRLRLRRDEQRWGLRLHQVGKLAAKLLETDARGRGEAGQLVWILEIIAPQSQHVTPRDRVARRANVHEPDLRTARGRIEELLERDRYEMAGLERDHHAGAALEQILRRAVAEVAGVLHVHRDRIGAAQLVADVLGRDSRLDAEGLEPLDDLGLENLSQID